MIHRATRLAHPKTHMSERYGLQQDVSAAKPCSCLSHHHVNALLKPPNNSTGRSHLSLVLFLGVLHDLLDNLLLLDEEGAGDAVLDTVGAARAAVRARNGLLGAGDLRVFAGTEGGDLQQIC